MVSLRTGFDTGYLTNLIGHQRAVVIGNCAKELSVGNRMAWAQKLIEEKVTNKAILAGVIALALLFFGVAVSRILFPYDSGHYEGHVWAPAKLTAEGVNPYARSRAEQPPYVMAPYGPLYYLLIGIGLNQFGDHFWWGRSISVAATALAVFCIGAITRRATGDRCATILAVVCFLSLTPVHAWLGVQKPDFVALGLTMLGITVALGDSSPNASSALLVATLFVAGVLCRQTAIVPIAIVAHWYWRNGFYCALAWYGAGFVGLLCLSIWYLNSTSAGGYIWQNFVLASQVDKSLAIMWGQVQKLVLAPSVIVTVAALAWLVHNRLGRRLDDRSKRLPEDGASLKVRRHDHVLVQEIGLFLAASASLSLVTCSRMGANINYWLEPCAAVSILVALLWAGEAARTSSAWTRRYFGLVVLLLFTGMFSLARNANGERYRWQSRPYLEEIVGTLAALPDEGPCFSVYPDLVSAAHKAYYFNDYCQYDGRSPLHQKMFADIQQAHGFSAVITH
ncbi:MAG TPA: hypothetical protein VHR66_25855, partial [Gemmataceae bacterium]|nr:hypothetical protein [Gemmataceae bacterium]